MCRSADELLVWMQLPRQSDGSRFLLPHLTFGPYAASDRDKAVTVAVKPFPHPLRHLVGLEGANLRRRFTIRQPTLLASTEVFTLRSLVRRATVEMSGQLPQLGLLNKDCSRSSRLLRAASGGSDWRHQHDSNLGKCDRTAPALERPASSWCLLHPSLLSVISSLRFLCHLPLSR